MPMVSELVELVAGWLVTPMPEVALLEKILNEEKFREEKWIYE